jgi:hypothetical protein
MWRGFLHFPSPDDYSEIIESPRFDIAPLPLSLFTLYYAHSFKVVNLGGNSGHFVFLILRIRT